MTKPIMTPIPVPDIRHRLVLIALTNNLTGEPTLIDPRTIRTAEPWTPSLIHELNGTTLPRTRIVFEVADASEAVFVTETTTEVLKRIRETFDPLGLFPVQDADTGETPDEYDDAPAPLPELPAPTSQDNANAEWHIGHIGPDREPVAIVRAIGHGMLATGVEVRTRSDFWTRDEARAFGRALLAAADWTHPNEDQADDTPAAE